MASNTNGAKHPMSIGKRFPPGRRTKRLRKAAEHLAGVMNKGGDNISLLACAADASVLVHGVAKSRRDDQIEAAKNHERQEKENSLEYELVKSLVSKRRQIWENIFPIGGDHKTLNATYPYFKEVVLSKGDSEFSVQIWRETADKNGFFLFRLFVRFGHYVLMFDMGRRSGFNIAKIGYKRADAFPTRGITLNTRGLVVIEPNFANLESVLSEEEMKIYRISEVTCLSYKMSFGAEKNRQEIIVYNCTMKGEKPDSNFSIFEGKKARFTGCF